MILKSIAQICKSSKQLQLINDAGRQWIGTSEALYRVTGLPDLDTSSLCSMFDIPESKQGKMYIDSRSSADFALDLQQRYEKVDIPLPTMKMQIAGEDCEVLYTSQGVRFMKSRYLKPLADEIKEGMLQFHERETKNGEVYIGITCGFFELAFVMPIIPGDGNKEEIEMLYHAMQSTLTVQEKIRQRKAEESQEDNEDEGEQICL